jgi:hypothetical protein
VETIAAYIALGNSKLVESVTGVPMGTVRQWKTQDWWRELEYQLREEGNLELDAKLKRIVNKSLDGVLDRLENGDFFYNVKTGNIDRMPAKLRDVAKVAADAVDKSVLLQKFTRKVEEVPKLDDHLRKLAQEFANIINGKPSDALHEERKAGLQAGTGLGEASGPVASEGSGGEEQSPEDFGAEEGRPEGCGAQESSLEGWEDDSGEPSSAASGDESVVPSEQGRVDEVGEEQKGV